MVRLIFAFVVALAAVLAEPAGAEDTVLATLDGEGAVMADKGGEVALTIGLTQPVGWRLWIADGPPRVVLELSDMTWTEEPVLRSTSVASLEIVETGPAIAELHAVLREPLAIHSAEMVAPADGTAALHVRLKPTTAEAFRTELEAMSADPDTSAKRLVVAIDPGHGGGDPGAETGDLREADLVLGFAKRLRDILVASGQFDAVLTRRSDNFVSLDARLTRARQAGADVLLSIHADALEDADAASGIVLYRLKPSAKAAANTRLIERHAPDDQLSGMDLTGAGDDVTLALLDLARQRAVPRSKSMSSALLQALEGAGLAVNSRPERAGEFAVLKAADIPSLLIELGFLSTEADLKRLTSEDWQTVAAEAIRDGLILWAQEDRLK